MTNNMVIDEEVASWSMFMISLLLIQPREIFVEQSVFVSTADAPVRVFYGYLEILISGLVRIWK